MIRVYKVVITRNSSFIQIVYVLTTYSYIGGIRKARDFEATFFVDKDLRKCASKSFLSKSICLYISYLIPMSTNKVRNPKIL